MSIKLWFVRRWLRLLPLEELEREVDWRRMTKLFNEAYEEIGTAMIDNFFVNSQPVQGIGQLGSAYKDTELDLNFLKNRTKKRVVRVATKPKQQAKGRKVSP